MVVIAAAGRHTYPRHSHDQFGVGILDSGGQQSASGRGVVEAWAGDVITVNPGEVHDGRPIGDQGRSWRMVFLDPPVVAAAFADLRQDGPGVLALTRPVWTAPTVAARIRALITAATADGDGDLDRLRRDHLILAALADLGEFRPRRTAPPTAIDQVRAAIDDDPATPRTLDQLARIAGLGRFQLARAFVRVTGLPPHAYILQRRLHLARCLIEASHLPLAEIAIAGGFADQSHLTRHFARVFGLPPGAYRRR